MKARQHPAVPSTHQRRPCAAVRLLYGLPLVAALVLASQPAAQICHAQAGPGSTQQQHHPAPVERRPPGSSDGNHSNQTQSSTQPARKPETAGQRHLGEWLEQHQGLSLLQQQKALDKEPGFTRLKPQVQQRMNQRLEQLNNMPPERRNRAIERIEAMERLSPDQRQQVRGAMRQLGSLPPDRRRAVAVSFHALQQMPPGQRQQYLNSPQIRSQFSEEERNTLSNLVRVAPLLPTPQR